jgi:hypothetical protein
MKRFLIPTVAVGLLAVPGYGAELKSGPQPGQSVAAFHPLNVTGPDAGQKACQV